MRKNLIFLFVLLLSASTSALANHGAKYAEACTSKDFKTAVRGCTQIIELKQETVKNRAWAYTNRATAYRNELQYDRAIADYSAALRLDPSYRVAYYYRGVSNSFIGQFDFAIRDFNAAIRLGRKDSFVYKRRGNAYRNLRQFDRAIRDFDISLRLNPKDKETRRLRTIAVDARQGKETEYRVFAQEAERAYKAKDYQRAIRGFTSAINQMEALGQTPKKNFLLKQYIERRARAMMNSGREQAGAAQIIRLIKLDTAYIYTNSDLVIKATGYLLSATPQDVTLLKWRAAAYESDSKYKAAIVDRTTVIKLVGGNSELASAYDRRSWPYRLTNQYQLALEDLNRAIELDAGTHSFFFNRAQVFKKIKQTAKAIADYTSALALITNTDRSYADYLYDRAKLYRQTGTPAKALADLNTVIAQDAKNSKSRGLRILILIEQKNSMQAVKELKKLKNSDPKYYKSFLPKAKALYDKQKAESLAKKTKTQPETKIRARHILVKTREDALDIIERLKSGADFASLAKNFSIGPSSKQGGDLGYFERGTMVKPFADAAFALKPGEYSGPVQTRFGWHVIKREVK